MKNCIILCATLCCLSAKLLSAGEEVTLKHVLSPPGVVQILTLDTDSEMTYVYKVDGTEYNRLKQKSTHRQKRIVTVLAVDAGNITK